MVCRAGGSFGKSLGAYQGVTQGGPLSSLMFNVFVDAVVMEWLWQVLGDDAAQGGMGEAAPNYVVMFFVDNGLVVARCPEWLQSSFTILTNLFGCIGFWTNAEKTEAMTHFLGKIQIAPTEEEYATHQAGEAAMMKCWCTVCNVCSVSLVPESLQSHLEIQNNICLSFVLN
jgi:hypothetical protein